MCYLLQTKLASYKEFIKQEMTENSANNMNCSLCTKFIKILKHNPECGTELKCDECSDDDDPVVALCVECKCFLCQDCSKVHSKKNKSHDILSLSSIEKGPAIQFTEKVLYYPDYQKNQLDCYNKRCDKTVCHHVGHTHDVENTASEHRNMLMKIIAPVEEMSENLSKANANIFSTQEKIKEKAIEIDQEIDKCYVEQLQKLNVHHRELNKQLHDAVLQKEDSLKEQLKDVTSLQDECKKLCEGVKKTPDRKVLFIMKKDMERGVQMVSEQYKNVNTCRTCGI